MEGVHGMNRLAFCMFVGLLIAACGAEAPEEPGARSAPTRINGETQPDQVERVPPEVVYQKLQKRETLLVCAYDTDVAFRAARLKGAISSSQFAKLLPTLDVSQKIVFYCA